MNLRPTRTTHMPRATGALAAVLLTAALAACGASSSDLAGPAPSESSPADAAPTENPAAATSPGNDSSSPREFQLADGSDGRPPFPELGEFDPSLTGEDMPDPCAWATQDLMAKLGYEESLGPKTLNGGRECAFTTDSGEGDPDRVVLIVFDNLSNRFYEENQEAPSSIPGVVIREDFYFPGTSHASVDTRQGAFLVSLNRYDVTESERQSEALSILETLATTNE